MPSIAFRAADLEDLKYIEENLRPADFEEFVYCTGRHPSGIFARSLPLHDTTIGLVDGRPVCAFGVEYCGDFGAPWLMGTEGLQGPAVARALLIEGRECFEHWACEFGLLRNWVYAPNTLHVRYIRALGCTVGEPEPRGPLCGMFREFTYGEAL